MQVVVGFQVPWPVFWYFLRKQDQNKLYCHMDSHVNKSFFWAEEKALLGLANFVWTAQQMVCANSKQEWISAKACFSPRAADQECFGIMLITGP